MSVTPIIWPKSPASISVSRVRKRIILVSVAFASLLTQELINKWCQRYAKAVIVFPSFVLSATPCRSGVKAIERTHGIETCSFVGAAAQGCWRPKDGTYAAPVVIAGGPTVLG